LITDLTVHSREDAIEKLRWYGLRWKIETFHKILKSGRKAEEARLRAAERIVNLLMGNSLALYLTKLARLGGYLARARDPPPGNTVIWRGLTRLTDIQLGFILGAQLVGMYGPPPCRKQKMEVTVWSAQMYSTFSGVFDSWPGWNALRSLPI
jgi:hypothetical protein